MWTKIRSALVCDKRDLLPLKQCVAQCRQGKYLGNAEFVKCMTMHNAVSCDELGIGQADIERFLHYSYVERSRKLLCEYRVNPDPSLAVLIKILIHDGVTLDELGIESIDELNLD